MNIICPQCQFSRQIPEERLPGDSAIATCPQCGLRFKVHKDVTAQKQDAHTGDDPLPPGAVILQQEAVAAYERQLHSAHIDAPIHKDDKHEDTFALDNPWEHPERTGYVAAFYQTVVRIMFAAPQFFAGLRAETSHTMALRFYLLVSVCQIIVERLWGDVISGILQSNAVDDPQLLKLAEILMPQTDMLMSILLRTAIVTMELFVASAIFYLFFKAVAPQKAKYSLVFQVMAYSAAPVLLCIVPVAGSVAGFIWSIACSFVGCRYALGLTWGQTLMGLVPVYALGIPFVLHAFNALQGIAN